jgi:APA family basic amino acid/polyamine antiporter
MGAPRILYGLAEQRMFPAAALRVNRGGTPTVALGLSAAAALGLTLTGQFATVFLIMAALGIVPFVVADFALFKLRRTAPELPRPYRAKLYPWLPAAALLLDVGMLIAFLAADWTSGLFIVAAIAICVPIGLWMRRNQAEPILLG